MKLYTLGEITVEDFSTENMELRDRMEAIKSQLAAAKEPKKEINLAEKMFELSQSLKSRWVTDYAVKRRILEMVCLNFRLEGASLVPEWRKGGVKRFLEIKRATVRLDQRFYEDF